MDKQEQNTSAAPDSTPESPVSEGKFNSAKQKLGALADKAKQHDFKGDAKAAAEGAKALKESLKKHDFKAELKEAFTEARKSPASIWKKPETPRPGKELAVVGLVAAIVLLLLLLVTSNSFIGLVCFVLGIGALLFCMLGLKTEGRKLAVGGSVVGILVILCAFGQTFGPSGGTTYQWYTYFGQDPIGNETVDVTVTKDFYPLLVENEGEKTGSAGSIIGDAAEQASKLKSLNFYGFYPGMSAADAKTLRDHYGLEDEQLRIDFNKANGEVFRVCFTPKALNRIMEMPNNFDTISEAMLEYFGIVAWNNEREVIHGEIDALFQDEEERFWDDKSNVPRLYKTADGVVAKLYPKGWDSNKNKPVFEIYDNERIAKAVAPNRFLPFFNKIHAAGNELHEQGVKTLLMNLGGDVELLMKEDPENNRWISVFPIMRWQWEKALDETRISKRERDDLPVHVRKEYNALLTSLQRHYPAAKIDEWIQENANQNPGSSVPNRATALHTISHVVTNVFIYAGQVMPFEKLTDMLNYMLTNWGERHYKLRGSRFWAEDAGSYKGYKKLDLVFWKEPVYGEYDTTSGSEFYEVYVVAAPQATIDAWTKAEKATAPDSAGTASSVNSATTADNAQ